MINFRPHLREDIALRVKWLNNKKANLFAIDNPEHTTTEEEQKKWFDEYENNQSKKFFTICSDDMPIGIMGVSNIDEVNKSANLFILIGEDNCRGKGIGKQAVEYLIDYSFGQLGLKTILLEVNKKNKDAINLFQDTNFVKAGENDTEILMKLEK